jgi:hypothetical protein
LIPRSIRLLLYPVFSLLLLIPAVRRLRREPRRWNGIRFIAAMACLAAASLGIWWGAWWLAAMGGLGLAGSLLLRPAPDPDRERELQRHHRADYLLNGGRLCSPWPAALDGQPVGAAKLYLLLRGQEILLVPMEEAPAIRATIRAAEIEDILVGSERYRPVYISEAKDPPVREQAVDKKAKTVMTLVLAGGGKLQFEYEGAFSKHLAESAAHAIYSVRKLGAAHGVSGESPEIFHIVGR